jgi:hypothetical protein
MRFLALALAGLAVLSFVSLTAEPVQAVGLCAYDDVYNNMGGPGSECEGALCMGYNSQTGWQTCVPDELCDVYNCWPPCGTGCLDQAKATSTATIAPPAVCTTGDHVNTAVGPSSGCDGAVCTGFSNGDWKTCVLDCTADGCPRLFADPCDYLMCQPPMDP